MDMESTLKRYSHNKGLTWKGDPRHHQEQAALALIEAGIKVFAWSWATVECDEPMCLTAGHLLVSHPERLEYPKDTCVYCGAGAEQRDHLLPSTYTDAAERRSVLTVPACAECNKYLSDAYTWSIDERRIFCQKRIKARHKKALRYQILSEGELREFGPGLRPAMAQASLERREVEARLSWPEDPLYDLRYLQKSGIEDPWAFGILSSPVRMAA